MIKQANKKLFSQSQTVVKPKWLPLRSKEQPSCEIQRAIASMPSKIHVASSTLLGSQSQCSAWSAPSPNNAACYIPLSLLCSPFQVENNDDDVTQELLIYRCTSNYYMTWVMSICGFKGILLIFGVFLAWETRNVHYPSLNDSKNIGLAVYNVFMFSCLALVVEFVVTYPPLNMLVARSIVLVGTTSTISLLFVPKVRNCPSSFKAIFQST